MTSLLYYYKNCSYFDMFTFVIDDCWIFAMIAQHNTFCCYTPVKKKSRSTSFALTAS